MNPLTPNLVTSLDVYIRTIDGPRPQLDSSSPILVIISLYLSPYFLETIYSQKPLYTHFGVSLLIHDALADIFICVYEHFLILNIKCMCAALR